MCRRLWMAILVLAPFAASIAHADVFRPAYLELRESGPDRYDVLWNVPAMGDRRLAGHVVFPADVTELAPPQGALLDDAYSERWQVRRPGGLNGQLIAFE